MTAPLHPRENDRLAALKSYGVLDTPREHRFDRIVFTAAQIMRVPIALVTLIGEERQWIKAGVGVSFRETSREAAFCAFAILQDDVLVVENAETDARFAYNPLVAGAPFIRFYAGVPLKSEDGLPLGTLCVIDRQPRRVSPEQVRKLIALARQTEGLLYNSEALLTVSH